MGAMPIPPDLRPKLAKVLGMLGSDFDGEIAAAGRQAHSLLKKAGLTWDDVIAPSRRWRRPTSPSDTAALCLQWPEVLTDWECQFLRSLTSRYRISPKQSAILDSITTKVEVFARASGEV